MGKPTQLLSVGLMALLSGGAWAQQAPVPPGCVPPPPTLPASSSDQKLGPVTLTGTAGDQPQLQATYSSLWDPHTQARWTANLQQDREGVELHVTQDLTQQLQAEVSASQSWQQVNGQSTPTLAADLSDQAWQVKLGGSARPGGWYELHLAAPLSDWWSSRVTLDRSGTRGVSVESPTTAISAQLQGETVLGKLRQKLAGKPTWLELDATYKGTDLEELDAGYSYKLGPLAIGAKAGRTFLPETIDSVKGDLQYAW